MGVAGSSSKEFDWKSIKMEKIEVDENVKPLMGSFFINKDPLVLVSNYDSYLSLVPPDCTLYSDDGQEFQVHKELLCQTKIMRTVIANATQDCCCRKLEFVFDSCEKSDLEDIVQFLYSGQILFSDQMHAAKVLSNLTKYLGFPELVDVNGGIKQEGIKVDEDLDLTFDYAKKVGDKTGGLFDLNTKLQNHTGIKIHNCHYCGKGFAYKKGLRRHIRNMHEMDHIPVKNELLDEDDPDFTFGEPLIGMHEGSEESGDVSGQPFVYDATRPTMVSFPSAFPTLDEPEVKKKKEIEMLVRRLHAYLEFVLTAESTSNCY